MEARYTPGPWEVAPEQYQHETGHSEWRWIGPVGWKTRVARVVLYDGEHEMQEANARLIASAPDHAMIASALCSGVARWERAEFCIDGLRHSTKLDEFGVPVMTAGMRSAISKAQGVSA